ncbi:MAG TPA: hypothetical protein VK689_23060, partial [Armatimonadota bacterium]|nr:hypothetical protein [Armatimonadota bacterium]
QVELPITISGDAYLPVRTTARVRVRNVALAAQDANVLLYSNDPESVREYGILYEGLFDSTGTARLLYHHQNRMGRPFMFQIHLLNPSDNPVDVQIVEATAGPVLDTIQVGHRAGERYMNVAARDIGHITRIPPRGSRLIYGVQMADLLTVSGIYNLRIIRGGPLVAHVSAEAEVSHPKVTSDLVAAARSEPDTYPSPQKDETYEYTVGQNWTFMPMGRKAIAGKIPNKKLFGNYGVLYNLTVNLNNPTDEEQTVRVVLSPEAGWTRGAFMIDGKLIEAPQIAPPGDAVLWTAKLAPQGRRQVRIQGIPVGGSSYPVSLVVRP